jgi:tetratricopeptide (TPR) repeat protein
MRSFCPYPLATIFFALTLQVTNPLEALSATPMVQPNLIASIESKVREFVNQGNAYLAQGDPDNLMLNQPGIFSDNGDTLIENNGSALDSFEKALRLAPQDRGALYGRGLANLQIYLLKEYSLTSRSWLLSPSQRLQNAINDLAQLTQMGSGANAPQVFLYLGQALLLKGNYNDSIQSSLLALEKGTNKPAKAHKNLGLAYSQLMVKNPAPPNGPKFFNAAQNAWLQAAKLAPNDWLPYKWLAELHQYAHNEFGYAQASLQKATNYSQMAANLYQKSPQGQADRQAERRRQEGQANQAAQQRQEQLRLQSWLNRPCTPNPSGGALTRHMCLEGYLNPNSPQGKDQPMPEGWGR